MYVLFVFLSFVMRVFLLIFLPSSVVVEDAAAAGEEEGGQGKGWLKIRCSARSMALRRFSLELNRELASSAAIVESGRQRNSSAVSLLFLQPRWQ